jgi:ubiquinone/menaquinone biosynthesis C-methylase UbiE
MNQDHLRLCSSAEWAATVAHEILPWAVGERDLGDDVLEVGPGPGLTTELLRTLVPKLTAVEVDGALAAALARRMSHTNVVVLHADATDLPIEDHRFSAATCFTMLHHLPSAGHQDRLLAELRRVLRPGGLLVGVDSISSPEWLALHVGDTCVPVDPASFTERLRRAGFVDAEVELSAPPPARRFRFSGRVSLRG